MYTAQNCNEMVFKGPNYLFSYIFSVYI